MTDNGSMAQWLNGSMAQWLNGSVYCLSAMKTKPILVGIVLVGSLASISACGASSLGNGTANESRPQTMQSFPLDEYLSAVLGTNLSDDERMHQFEVENQRRNELITQCMHDAGFEFDAENIPGMTFTWAAPRLEDEWRPNDPEWVTQWGYGIVSRPQGRDVTTNSVSPSDFGISDSEYEAFSRALWGPPCSEIGEIQPNGVCMMPDNWQEDGGCIGQAGLLLAAETPSGLQQSDEFAPLFDAIDQMRANLRRDISEEEIDWAACMADNGFPVFERREAPEVLTSQPEWKLHNEYGEFISEFGLFSPEIATFQQREIDMALADLNCRIETTYQARQDARRLAAETQFVNDHRAELEAIRAAAEQRS